MCDMETVKGYKVFNPDWTCLGKQYCCPSEFEEDVELELCSSGMHFCENLADCFNYYDFNSANHVAEVESYGEVIKENDKCCTNKLRIIREIEWDEVLRICNTGDCNTGNCNTGNRNTGNRNTGDWNTGDCNTGDWNTGNRNPGDWNTGNCNTGNWNTGDRNTGDCNTGNRNTGDRNTGNWNTGNCNTGDCNTGNWNTGNRNTGNWNTGDRNTGDWNTGDWNTGDWNTGCFMTKDQTIPFFDKPSDWTYDNWLDSRARKLLNSIDKNVVEWIYSKYMTEEEKKQNPFHECTGGYLKILNESECAQIWWDGLPEEDRSVIMSLPNFDKDIFKECTGIDVDK